MWRRRLLVVNTHPNVLVLGGGGILGEAWMSPCSPVFEETTGFDARGCDGYVGTSAGSIVAAVLACRASILARAWESSPSNRPVADADSVNGGGLVDRALEAGLGAGRAVAGAAGRGGAARDRGRPVRSCAASALGRSPRGRRSLARPREEVERMGARWDGRLSISAVEVERGAA